MVVEPEAGAALKGGGEGGLGGAEGLQAGAEAGCVEGADGEGSVAALGAAGAAGEPGAGAAGGVGEGRIDDLDELGVAGGEVHEVKDTARGGAAAEGRRKVMGRLKADVQWECHLGRQPASWAKVELRVETMKMRRHRGCGNLELNFNPCALNRSRFLREAGNALRRVCAVLAVAVLLGLTAGAQSASQQSEGATIRGMVHSLGGQPVGDAEVRLEQKGVEGAAHTRTNAAGAFTFSSIKTGTYELSAAKAGLHSRATEVTASTRSDATPVDLVLEDAETAKAQSRGASPAQAMEFADKPNFTVAAVTDWTAAGGHGSDSILRTSEALTRETVALKPDDAGHGGAGHDGAGAGHGGDAHRLAGEADEKRGDPLAAVHEFEKAAREDPSEQNYFEWGSELLLHRAVWQAKAVFAEGAKAYPKSERMLTALGTALFSGALYDEAALRLCDASDLNPADPEPYIFMGKIEMAAPNPLACVEQKLARFVREQPENALANYYYAMTVWKQQGQPVDPRVLQQVETMLTKAVTLDPKCADGYLQLGNLNSSQRDYTKAIDFYNKAIAANPGLIEAHYRLGVAYDRNGERAKAKEQFQLHDQIQKQQAAEVDRQRREVKQFLVVEQGKPSYPPAQ